MQERSMGTSSFKHLKMNVHRCCYRLPRKLAQPKCDTGSAGLTYVVSRDIGANQKRRSILNEQQCNINCADNLVHFAVFVIILQPTVVWKLSTTTLPPIPAIQYITM